MIIKRELRLKMATMKRRRGEEEEGPPAARVKGRSAAGNGFYPVKLVSNAGGGRILFPSDGFWRRFVEEFEGGAGRLCSPEAARRGRDGERGDAGDAFRPPLVKTSRGRVQVLPSRFNDSVIDPWKKEKVGKSSRAFETSFDLNTVPHEYTSDKLSSKRPKLEPLDNGYHHFKERFGSRSGNYGEAENEPRNSLFRDSEDKRFLRHCSLRASVLGHGAIEDNCRPPLANGEFVHVVEAACAEKPWKGNCERRKDISRREEFVVGDIIWAKPGKKYPFWPAIVIDPMLSAPESVLKFCIPGASCVMFFGYSANGEKRVISLLKTHTCTSA